ncbi:ATP-binding cassette domain-containing protein [Rhodobacterales bacterium HKCCE3408]|nr:ATP-binding cassette domain-containing protein [Rhodobacterales bacterium HKCCE3408]
MPSTTAPEPAPALEVTDLTVAGEGGRRLIDVPALHIAPGERVVIRGPSGAGKSTLLYALAGLLPVTGRIDWGGTDIAALSERRRTAFRRATFGLVFQDYLLFEELSPAANAAIAASFGPSAGRAPIRDRAAGLLDRFGLVRGGARRVASFSGGERQRIAVARALAMDPPVILADEPTASLDRAMADRLIDDLLAACEGTGRTLIVVSHDPAFHDRLPRLIDMAEGRIVPRTPVLQAAHA